MHAASIISYQWHVAAGNISGVKMAIMAYLSAGLAEMTAGMYLSCLNVCI